MIIVRTLVAALAVAAVLADGPPAAAADAVVSAPAEAVSAAAAPKGWTLKGVVLFSRHGIRGPLIPADCSNAQPAGNCMDGLARRPWPTYGVIAENLIPDGYARVATLGRYYKALYAARGVLPAKGCPDNATFTTDNFERTVITAGALANGMFPGCAPPFSIEDTVYNSACGFDEAKADAASQALIGGSWADVANGELRRPLAVMNAVLGPFSPATCTMMHLGPSCRLSSVPVAASDEGPISIADQPSEQFLMQYAAGLPAKDVAWGDLPAVTGLPLGKAITLVNAIHALDFRASYMPRYQAVRQGSTVMSEVLSGLAQILKDNGPKFVVYAGHDNNILNMAGMLGLEWQLDSYQPYQVPPGGAVAFELWQRPTGPAVRLVYFAQTIGQMRDNTELTLANPPASAVMPVAGCASDHGACPWPDFRRLVRGTINETCVYKKPKGS